MSKLDEFISRLYRSTQHVNIEHFRDWALKELQGLISFDAAIWSTGHLSTRTFHTHTTLGLPTNFSDKLIEYLPINPISKELFNRSGDAVDMSEVISDEAFYKSEIYRQVFEPFGIKRILSSVHIENRSGIYTLLTIYRHDSKNVFLQDEKQLFKSARYHLLEAASHACLLSLVDESENKLTHYAICDKHGVYHEVEPLFLDLIENEYPDHESQNLPFIIEKSNHKTLIGQLIANVEVLGDLFRVGIRHATPLDTLTSREYEVVTGVTNGLSFKQIAKKLELSPSTVSNHLYRIYQKLNINNRSELADLIQEK